MTAQRYVEKAYLDELSYRLQMRGLGADKIGDILAEVETHVSATGEPARVAFGPPAEYARMWARQPDRLRWPVIARLMLVGGGAGFALEVGALGVIDGTPALGLSPWWLVGLGLVLFVTCPAIGAKHLIDPLTGQYPTGIRRKGLAVIVAGAVLLIFVVGLGALEAGALMFSRGDTGVGLGHWWLLGFGLALVVAAAAIFPVLRITDPRSGRPFVRSRWGMVLTASALAIAFVVVFLVLGLIAH